MRVLFLGGATSILGRACYAWLRNLPNVDVSDYVTDLVTDPSGWDVGVSVMYPHIVRPAVLEILPIANVHTGFLPWNRGKHPNVWPIIDGTPAGATLHWMDATVDTGDIMARIPVPVEPWDTAHTLYRKLEDAALDLFCANWWLVEGFSKGVPQRGLGAGSLHYAKELPGVTLDLDGRLPVRETLAILRARSFPGYPGVRFTEDGKTWEVTVNCQEVHGD